MKLKKTEFTFKLTKSIKIQSEKTGGGFEIKEYKELRLVAPSKKNQYLVGDRLQGMYSLAVIRMGKEARTGEEDLSEINDEKKLSEKDKKAAIRISLITGLQKDSEKFYKTFEKLLLKEGICYAGDNKISDTDLIEIEHEDFKELTVEYIANFFYTCWMKVLNGN